ncbi:MAG TPA: LUD domain-containing protein [Candidatus Cybelea sp.]|nr:LUD domain-containing protein [Candidatus Cybelea sp.]
METPEHPGRERILRRIESALARSAPKQASTTAQRLFAPVSDPLSRFRQECAANITECVLTRDTAGTADALRDLLAPLPAGEIYIEDTPLLRRIAQRSAAGRALRWSGDGAPGESSEASITLAESLIASTGSVLIASSGAGRGASVIPPVHIVVASQSQLEPDLPAALARAQQKGLAERSSCLFLITGSSRTADIEKILVLGAHGPRRLVILLAEHLD